MSGIQRSIPPTLYDSAIIGAITPDATLNELAQLLIALGRALHEVGQPAHKVERTLVLVAERFNVPLQILVMPTGHFLSILRDEGPLTFVLRMKPGAVDLDRLSRLMAIADGLIGGTLTPFAAKAKIDKTMELSAERNSWAIVAAYALSAAPFSIFFGGGWQELLVSTCVGLVVGMIAALMKRRRRNGNSFELIAAAAAALIAGSADELLGGYGGWIPLAAGLVVLLPGIALVDALEELASGQLTAGASRLAGVGVVFLALTFGSVIGYAIADLLPAIADRKALHVPEWFIAPALVAVAFGSMLRFRAALRDWWVILAASGLALIGSRLGKQYAGDLAGPFLAAALLAVGGQLYARFSRRAAELVIVPGIALLVPGSVGYQSLEAFLSQETTHGVDTAFQMFLIGIALVAGLLFGNAAVGERQHA